MKDKPKTTLEAHLKAAEMARDTWKRWCEQEERRVIGLERRCMNLQVENVRLKDQIAELRQRIAELEKG